jgi:2-polyprenyl-6-methoxyphenol hydroxylase-like FAD-dependent oxidoreductase
VAKGLRTLIVGAGVAGLALAAALRRAGLAAEVAERRPADAGEGTGIHLAGNAVRVLDRLDVAEAVASRAFRVRTIHYTDAAGDGLFRVDLAATFPDAPFLGAHRADLHAALLEATGRDAVRFGVGVAGLDDDGEAVEVAFEDGSRERFDLVVGADGVGSTVRKAVWPDARPEPFGDYWSWRFVTGRPDGLDEPVFMLGRERTMLLFPVGGARLYCGAGPIRVPGEPPRGDALLPWLREAYAGFGGHARAVLAGVTDPDTLAPSRIWSVRCPAWHRGRVVLVGDAAHACPPTLAQGAALALEDAWVLAGLLSEGGDISGTLAAFERRRRPRADAVQAASESRMTVTDVGDEAGLAVRDALLRRIGAERLVAGWRPLIEQEP